jgi:hypothetical protein
LSIFLNLLAILSSFSDYEASRAVASSAAANRMCVFKSVANRFQPNFETFHLLTAGSVDTLGVS